ncbi:hypothetical protein [Jiangella gansuensis]|uniref:hypothetical protein n=1 Tax=Jiangella gansuensis TaxID=281473 RepID=UPI0012FAFCB8|nr:hypothetical protein [Jiangella gansuensis]
MSVTRPGAASRRMAAPAPPAVRASDAVVGAAATGRAAAVRVVEYGAVMVGITARLVWHGSAPVRALVPQHYRAMVREAAATIEADLRFRVAELARRGDVERQRQAAQVSELLDRLVPLIVAEVVERIDLTHLVTENVDLDAIAARIDVDAIADRVDTERVVDRLDLAAIADQVLDEIDLPEIIRSSTGSLASSVVVGVRKRGIEADDVVAGVVDRLLRRNRR